MRIHETGADAEPAVMAERTLLAARRRALEHELEVYAEELHNYETTLELLMARRDQTAVHAVQAEQSIRTLRAALNARRRQEVQKQADLARQAAADSHPAVRRLAAQNADRVTVRAARGSVEAAWNSRPKSSTCCETNSSCSKP